MKCKMCDEPKMISNPSNEYVICYFCGWMINRDSYDWGNM